MGTLGLVLLLALFAGLFVRSRLDGWVLQALAQRVARDLGGQLSCQRLSLRLLPPEVAIRELDLRLPLADGGSLRVGLGQGRARLSTRGLLGLPAGRIRLAALELDRPLVRWVEGGGATVSPRSAWRPVDLEIGRLVLRDGVVAYADHAVPIELRADEVGIRADWELTAGALAGRAEWRAELSVDPLAQPLALELASRFRLRRHDLEIRDLTAAGPGVHVTLEGNLRLQGTPQLVGRGTAGIDLDQLQESLEPRIPSIGGRLSAEFGLEAGAGFWKLFGDVEAVEPRFGTLAARQAHASVRVTPGLVELLDLSTSLFGGQVNGSLEFGWSRGGPFEMQLEGRGLEGLALFEQIGLPLPLAARVDMDARLSGAASDRAGWSGGGQFAVDPVAPARGQLPVAGRGGFTVLEGALEVRSALELAAARLEARVFTDLARPGSATVELEGSTLHARDTQIAAERVLTSLGIELPSLAREPLAGAGPVRASIRTGPETEFAIGLDLAYGRYGSRPFDRAQLEIGARGGTVTVEQLALTSGEERLTGRAVLQLSPFSVEGLEVAAVHLEPAWLLAAAGLPQELTGRLSAELIVRREAEGRAGHGRFSVVAGAFYGESFDRIDGALRIQGDTLEVEDLTFAGTTARGSGFASWRATENAWAVTLDSVDLDLARLSVVRAEGLPLEGRVALRGAFRGGARPPQGELALETEAWSWAGLPVGPTRGSATLAGEELAFELEGMRGPWQAAGLLALDDDWPLEGRLDLERTLVELGEGQPPPVWALVSGHANVTGPLADPQRIGVRGQLKSVKIHSAATDFESAGPVEISLEGGRLSVSPIHLVGAGTDLHIRGGYDVTEDNLEASAEGQLDLGLLTAALPELLARGHVSVRATAQGPLGAPELVGALEGQQGRLRWRGFPQSIDDLAFRIEFAGRQARLRELRGRFGNGELRAAGQALLARTGLESFLVVVDAANTRVTYPEGFRGVYEGRITLSGTGDQTNIAGDVTLLLGVYDREFDLTGRSTRAYAVPDDSGLPEGVTLDLHVRADDNLWLRNELAEVESAFDLEIGGTLRRPEITGRLWMVEGGKLVYRDVEYQLTAGTIDFLDLDRLDPYLTLRAETTVDNYTVYLRVEGTLERFDYELTSDPTLPTPDIIALLATGRTLEESTGQSTGAAPFTGDLAASYFTGALTGRFEHQLERLLGLEKIRIDPFLAEGESDPTTRLTVGEEVAEDLWVVFSADLTRNERQLYQVDWHANRRFRISAQRDTQGGVGADVRYRRRFWWNKRTATAESPLAAPPSDDATGRRPSVVTSIVIAGVPEAEAPRLREKLALQEGQPFSRSEMYRGVEALKRHYVRRQHVECRVDAEALEGDHGISVVYQLVPGPPVQLAFEGATRREERRLRSLLEELWIEAVFTDVVYADAEARIRDFYQERGHYAIDVMHEIHDTSAQREVRFVLERGTPVRVEAVTIEGADQLGAERVRAQMLTRPSTLLSRRILVPRLLAEDAAAVRSLYRSEGFLDAEVAEPRVLLFLDGDSADIEVHVEEGRRSVIESIEFSPGLPFTNEELSGWAGLEVGQVFSPLGLHQAESRLRSGIDARGYPDGRVRGQFERQDGGVRVSFDVTPHELRRVGEVLITGNGLTRDKIIARELSLSAGDPISREELLRTQHRLYRLGLFRSVALNYTPLGATDPSSMRLNVRVEETAPLAAGVGLGYDTEARALASFSLTHENLGGYDRVLSIQGKVSGLERRLQLVGKEPRLFGRQLPALVSSGWSIEERNDFTEERVTAALRVAKEIAPHWTTLLRYSLQQVDLSDVQISPEELEEEKLVDGRLGDAGITFIRDTRDSPFLPRQGSYLALGARLFAEGLGSQFTFVKNDATWSIVRPVGGTKAFASAVRVGLAVPFGDRGTVPTSEAYFAGGDSTLRGFPRDDVGPASGGESLLLVNEEFRFPILRALKGILFYDVGNVWDDTADFDPTDLRHVLGTGLRLETPIGPLRVEYGRKLDREPDESTGELFLAIGSAF